MAKAKPPALTVKAFADHQVITQPNPLRRVMQRLDEKDLDDPVKRAEQALAGLSSEFEQWMAIECERLAVAHAAILKDGFSTANREELFRAAHDIKGDAATFGFRPPPPPPKACAGSSSTRPTSNASLPS